MRILVVEDEYSLADAMGEALKRENYMVDISYEGNSALDMALSGIYDIIILDLMLPNLNGLEILKYIREEKISSYVMILTAKGELDDKVKGLDYGADDYMTKPFSPKVLVAKSKALLKRTIKNIDSSSQNFNGLTINKLSHEVKVNDTEISLSPKEYELLLYLISNEGIALSRDTILDNVWGFDYYGDIRTVDTNIKRLREKLLDKANYIVTVRGSGYKFEVK